MTLGGHRLCARPCAGHAPCSPLFILTTPPILPVRKPRPTEALTLPPLRPGQDMVEAGSAPGALAPDTVLLAALVDG